NNTLTTTYTERVSDLINNNCKEIPVDVQVSVALKDKEMGRKTLTVSANSSALAEFTGFDLQLGFSKGRVHIDSNDPLKVDDDFLFALERREKLKLLTVGAGKAKQSQYLRQAYTPSPDLPFEVSVLPASALTPEQASNPEVGVIHDVPRPPGMVPDPPT